MRTVYLGTSDSPAAGPDRLAAGPHRPALVVPRPDSRQGRGRALAPPPVAVRARELGLDVVQPERLHEPEVLERIAAAQPGGLCVCAYGGLIKEPLLSAYEVFNVHPALLPRRRGAPAAAPGARPRPRGGGEEGRRRGDRLPDQASPRGTGLGAGGPAGARADRARRRLRHARRAPARSRRPAARPRPRRAPAVRRAGRG